MISTEQMILCNIRESNTSHGYQQDKRERMYGWVERHFLGRDVESSREIPFCLSRGRD